MKRIIQRDVLFYLAIVVFIILLGQLPIILRILHAPMDRYYPLLDKVHFTDYAYPAAMRFAMEGQEWMLKSSHVWADHQPSLMWFLYVVLGKVAALTGLGPFEIFALFRVAGGILLLVAAALVLRSVLPKRHVLLAFVFFVFAQPFPFWNNGNIFAQDIGHFVWDTGEAARRISSLPPHYSLGKGLMLLSLGLTVWAMRIRKNQWLVVACAAAAIFAAGFIYPMPVFLLLFIVGVSLFVSVVLRKVQSAFRSTSEESKPTSEVSMLRHLFVFLPILAAGLIPLIVLKMDVAAKGFPWTLWNTAELGYNTPGMQFELRYVQMLGPLLLLVPFGIWPAIRSRMLPFTNLFVLVWFFSPFLLFPFADALSFGKQRFIEAVGLLPTAILAVWGWQELAQKATRTVGAFLIGGFLGYFLLFGSLVAHASTMRLWGYFTNVYLRREELAALEYLRVNAAKDSVVLAYPTPSNFIPAFARVRTIVGNPVTYKDAGEYYGDAAYVNAFLAGSLSEADAYAFLAARSARYVYTEVLSGRERRLYPGLIEKIFDNGSFVIYVRKGEY